MTGNALHRDRHGLTIGTADGEAASRYQAGVDLFMSGNPGGEAALREAAAADPGFALAPAALTMVLRDTGRRDEARETADLARSLAAGASRRERQHVEAIAVLAHGDGPRAFALMRDHLAEFPRDALILLGADRYLFYSGGENRQQLQFELLDGFAEAYDGDWWFPGQFGFALGECGHYEKAVGAARSSLALNPKNLWAAHTLAHVYADTKDDEKGAAFLGPWLGDFDPRAPMFGHSSWHLTLFELGRGRHARAMEIYRTGVCPAACKHRSTLNNSASFLWRCMVYGYAPTAGEWDELQPLADRHRRARAGRMGWHERRARLRRRRQRGGKEPPGRRYPQARRGRKGERGRGRASAGRRRLGVRPRRLRRDDPVDGAGDRSHPGRRRQQRPARGVLGRPDRGLFADRPVRRGRGTADEPPRPAPDRSRPVPARPGADRRRQAGKLGAGRLEEGTGNLRRAAEGWRDADPGSPEVAAIDALLQRMAASVDATPSPF